MIDIILSILPVFLVVIAGAFLKKYQMPGNDFWPLAEKLTYYILLPSLFFLSVARADFASLNISLILILLTFITFIMVGVVFLWQWFYKSEGPAFSSVFQGSIRYNNYIGVACVAALYGDIGIGVTAILIAALVPTLNGLCLAVLNYYGSTEQTNLLTSITTIFTNPLIIACLAGLIVNLIDVDLPLAVHRTLTIFSDAALALGLLSVGAGLNLAHTKNTKSLVMQVSFIKLVIFPLVALAACLYADYQGVGAKVLVLYSGLPAASTSYIMARKFGGDATLMAGILVAEILLSMLTMPILILLIERLL